MEIKMPKMGESVEDATIMKWFVKENDQVEEEQPLAEITTDKVDSEIPSPIDGKIVKILYGEDETVNVGEVIAVIQTDDDDDDDDNDDSSKDTEEKTEQPEKRPDDSPEKAEQKAKKQPAQPAPKDKAIEPREFNKHSSRFYSPLVITIAEKEGVSFEEIEAIEGSGRNGRVQKDDLLNFLKNREKTEEKQKTTPAETTQEPKQEKRKRQPDFIKVKAEAEDEVIEMDRLTKITAEHMIFSKQNSAHVTNILEADVTNMVMWRNKVKKEFAEKEGVKLTFLPIIIEATAKALKEFPRINAAVDGDNIILRKRYNIGIATALPDDNLVVPVIKDADGRNLIGLAKELNRLATNAREGQLGPDDFNGGTFSISNFGSFRNLTGTPIINQPQVAILAVGTIEKKPAVVESALGDTIAIRHKMYLALTYDHRIVNGALAGRFLRRLADMLEQFDTNRTSF